MTVDMERYEKLLQQFGEISQNYINEETLKELKAKYRDEIHSRRVLNDIVDIPSLLKVLEKRGILQYDDISVLTYITNQHLQEKSNELLPLITEYNQWFEENSGSINFLYSSGKSNIYLTNHDLNTSKTLLEKPETVCLSKNFDKNYSTSIKDIANESLLPNESLNNLNLPQNVNNTDQNSFFMINFKKCSPSFKKKESVIVLILLILLLILTGIVWIVVKLPYKSTAIVPTTTSYEATSRHSQNSMPSYMENFSARNSTTQSTFATNYSQVYMSTVPPVDKEKELQTLVISKLSKKIGKFWNDVCRALEIEEYTIDEITIQYSKEPQKYELMFKKGLEYYFSESRPNWKIDLMRALKSANRVDLQEMVENIFLRNNQ